MRTRIISIAVAAAVVAVGGLLLAERYQAKPAARPLPLADGEQEIAWFNTTTNFAAWERFVTGIQHAARQQPNLNVDLSQAFLESTTAVPEVAISWKDRPGKLRVRWYKQTNEMGTKQWIDALAERDRPPLAVIGGGSSDRARDLARDLSERAQWKGPRPLFFITTATANEVTLEGEFESRKLTGVYPGHTFRFCFTNEQMARAVIDFVWRTPNLKPPGRAAMEGGEMPIPIAFPVYWKDDPYSDDLNSRFWSAVSAATKMRCDIRPAIQVDYSVGTFDRANASEASGAKTIVEDLEAESEQRCLLILPTSTAPARRFIRAMCGESPAVGRQLVAVNGDAIGINDVYRDGALQWNVRDVPVPLVFFAHQNPIGWEEDLPPPGGTDEILLFSRMFEVILKTALPPDGEPAADSNVLRERVRAQRIIPFDEDGNRKEGDEYVVYLQPEIGENGRIAPKAALQVWRRSRGRNWQEVETPSPLTAPYDRRARREN